MRNHLENNDAHGASPRRCGAPVAITTDYLYTSVKDYFRTVNAVGS